jgi:hypothetical protein
MPCVTMLRLLTASVRAWYVLVLGLVLTAGAAFFVWASPGVYYGQVDVVFLRPVNQFVPNSLSITSSSVIATAGVVQREVSGGRAASRVVSEGVTVVGEGITSGQRITLPNSGGQWANNFDRALLDVQVVDRSEHGARERLDAAVAAINQSLERRQQAAGADRSTWIRTRLSPAQPTVHYMDHERRRGVAMTLLLGVGTTLSAVVLWEGRRARGRNRGAGLQVLESPDGERTRP